VEIKKIDINPDSIGESIVRSLRETGFAIIKNHGIKSEVLDKAYKAWTAYFVSNEKFKDQFKPNQQEGYYPMKSENAKGYDKKDLKEFFHIYPHMALTEAHGGNDTWSLYNDMHNLGLDLLDLIDKHSQVDGKSRFSQSLRSMAYRSPKTLLRILHYPPLEGETDGAVRAAAHEDINLITLLPAATYPGLQVLGADGEWFMADTDPDSIIINAGDMLQEASGGYFKSTTHRVINPTGVGATVSRYSMPMFVHPHPEVRLSEKYTAEEYLDERLRELGLK
jgi:isopenicillin N synthase-like dioxygenase